MLHLPFHVSQVRNLAALDTALDGSPMPTDFKLTSAQFCDHLRKVRSPTPDDAHAVSTPPQHHTTAHLCERTRTALDASTHSKLGWPQPRH